MSLTQRLSRNAAACSSSSSSSSNTLAYPNTAPVLMIGLAVQLPQPARLADVLLDSHSLASS